MKILVIGGGSIGHRYAAYAQDLTGQSALLDIDPEKTARFEKSHGGIGFTDFDTAMGWNPDGVIVATPHTTHMNLATKVIEAGKPALIEKPIGENMKDVEKFLKLLKKKNGRAWTVCNMRFHPAVRALHENIDKIGPVFFTRAHFGNWLPNMRPGADYRNLYCARKEWGGGLILDGIHEIDYLLWLLGSGRSIMAVTSRRSDLEIDVEDYADLTLVHESGAVSEIHMDYLQQCKRRGCEIVGQEGTLIWTSEGKKPESCQVRLFTSSDGWKTLYESGDLDNAQPYKEMIEYFIRAIKNPDEKTVLASAAEGAAALETAIAAYKSVEKKKQIRI